MNYLVSMGVLKNVDVLISSCDPAFQEGPMVEGIAPQEASRQLQVFQVPLLLTVLYSS